MEQYNEIISDKQFFERKYVSYDGGETYEPTDETRPGIRELESCECSQALYKFIEIDKIIEDRGKRYKCLQLFLISRCNEIPVQPIRYALGEEEIN